MIIGVKVVVTKVMKLYNPDGTPQKDAAGTPAYWFQSMNVVQTLSPEEYKAVKNEGIRE